MKTLTEFGQPECILVDFRNLTDTSFYAYGDLSVQYPNDPTKVFHTGAIYGFLNRVLDLQRHASQAKILIAQEGGGESFRKKLHPAYKAERKVPDLALREQFGPLAKICRNMGWSVLSVPGHEADDVIATWATKLNQDGRRGLIVSNDKDLLTFITPTMGALRKGEMSKRYDSVMTPEDVVAKHGVSPALNSEFLALVGDVSDEYKGLQGVGEKTAPGLLNKYGSIKGIYENLQELSPGLRKKFEEGREHVEISLKIANLVTDLPAALEVLAAPAPAAQMETIRTDLVKIKMESILRRMDKASAVPAGVAPSVTSTPAVTPSAQTEFSL